jgi:hypothetical protein
MDSTPFLVANAPIMAVTIFMIVSMGILCYTMDGLWAVSAYALVSVVIADLYLMTFFYIQWLENVDSESGHLITNVYITRCALTLAHAYPLLCMAHLSKYTGTQFGVMCGILLLCVLKPVETNCVGDTDAVVFNGYGLVFDMVCIIMAMSYMLYDISLVLRNSAGVVLYSLVLAIEVAGSCLLNTQFKECNTYATFYTQVMGIGVELMLFCYLLLFVSSQVNSTVHCASCCICDSNDGCFSCTSCNGFATVKKWKNVDMNIFPLYSMQLVRDEEGGGGGGGDNS